MSYKQYHICSECGLGATCIIMNGNREYSLANKRWWPNNGLQWLDKCPDADKMVRITILDVRKLIK